VNALGDTVIAVLSLVVWCVAYAPVPLALGGAIYGATRFVRSRFSAA
jgi:hypothetical protein